MTLIDNIGSAHKLYSLVGAVMLAIFDALHIGLPVMQQYIDPPTFAAINLAGVIGIAVARVIKQYGLQEPSTRDPKDQTP